MVLAIDSRRVEQRDVACQVDVGKVSFVIVRNETVPAYNARVLCQAQ
jgi:hypothetical protein